MSQLWRKSDKDQVDRDWFFEFTASEDRACDEHLIPYDIKCNIAQTDMLEKIGILSPQEAGNLRSALKHYYHQWKHNEFHLTADDEDVHSAIENRLTADCGEAGKKIHTGRSRNDQVQTDIRLYVRDRLLRVASDWMVITHQLIELAKKYRGVFFAGHTHTQPAMPTSVDAWAYGYIDLLLSDLQSLRHIYEKSDVNPLGSAAGFGVPFLEIDRELTRERLGFSQTQHAVTSVQLSRGKLESGILHMLMSGALTFNRMGADIIFFAQPTAGFVHLSEDQTSGSSIMPQKRNPDAWELIRAGYAQLSGIHAQLSMAGLNLIGGYHRDLQTVKQSLIEGFERIDRLNRAVSMCLKGLQFDTEACKKSLTPELFATHKALAAVIGGGNFRDAYRQAGQVGPAEASDFENQLSTSYSVAGYPGVPATGEYQAILDDLEHWVKNRIAHHQQVDERLLNEPK